MKRVEGTLRVRHAASGRTSKLYRQSWLPEEPPVAGVLLAHGFGEHSGRYHHVARHLVERGIAVHACDHSGHGRSDGTPGHVDDFRIYLEGIGALLDHVRPISGRQPLFLVGHSMGGLISATFLLGRQAEFAGCVLSGAAVEVEVAPAAWMLALTRLLSRLTPRLGIMQIDPAGISRDGQVVADYLADPLVFKGKASARLVSELFARMDALEADAGRIELPLLLLHGDSDVLASPRGSKLLCERCGSTDRTLKIYPGLFHEIFNEPEREDVLSDMSDWIIERLPGESSAQPGHSA